MAVLTIAGLTIKEAVRRRTLIGALLLGLLVFGLSLLLELARSRMQARVDEGRIPYDRFIMQYTVTRHVLMGLTLSAIKWLGTLFALMLAGGAISGEIERGLLSVILPKPIPRWQILLGKWLGMNLVLIGSVLVWTVMIWASFTLQLHQDLTALLKAGLILTLFPITACTLALSLSTFAQRLLGTSLAMTICAFAWFDGIFNGIGVNGEIDILQSIAKVAGLVFPQGYIGWWVDYSTRGIIEHPLSMRGPQAMSPTFLTDWGQEHLHFAHFDAVYLVFYILVVFLIGAWVFHKRDV